MGIFDRQLGQAAQKEQRLDQTGLTRTIGSHHEIEWFEGEACIAQRFEISECDRGDHKPRLSHKPPDSQPSISPG